MSVPVVTELSDMFKALDSAATTTLMAKMGVEKTLTSRLDETRNSIQTKVQAGGRPRGGGAYRPRCVAGAGRRGGG